MRNFNSLMMVAVAAVSLSACTQTYADQEVGYLGSRDDIVVSNTAKAAQAKIETTRESVETTTAAAVKQVSEPVHEVSMASKSIAPAAGAPAMPAGATGDVPPNARAGECYAKVLIPAKVERKTERFQVSEEQKVLDRIIPARYETKTERVKVREARKYWKSGHGPITKVNEVTGEILCLVEEPAEYRTIEKRVLVAPEQPKYKMIPAKFDTVTRENIIQAERWEWRRILCQTNLSSAAIMQIQRGLNAKGSNIAVDGRLGNDTLNAINRYQLKHGLASRGITYETLNHMGVALTGA